MNSINTIMNEEEIKKLLIKFFDGEATEDDEKLLRAVFNDISCPTGFEAEWEYFRFCLTNSTVPEASFNLEDRIEKAIDESDRHSVKVKGSNRYLIFLSGVAATALLLFGTYYFIESRNKINDTYSDPEIAYAETMKILMDVSLRLNKGTSAMAPVGRLNAITEESLDRINHSSSVINESLLKINGVIKTTSEINKSKIGSVNK
ncbi:MAG: hypothetical protein HZB98_11960 [Bacteroidia bacterium]|nr:hypothetical protein [Bacteroidia bacterium]